jgi:hypothetical protein
MSKLFDAQIRFVQELPFLLVQARMLGYEITIGDAYRDPRAFGDIGEIGPYGHPSSKHKRRLAIDLNLFRDGKYLIDTEDYRELGEYWESVGGKWGGRFNDGNHFEWPIR